MYLRHAMYRLHRWLLSQEELDQDVAPHLATCVCQLLAGHFYSNLFPQQPDEEYVIFILYSYLPVGIYYD